jgi:hypothetical protein
MGALSKLYDRALRSHAKSIAIATPGQESALFAACDRTILLTDDTDKQSGIAADSSRRVLELPRRFPDAWEHILATLSARR